MALYKFSTWSRVDYRTTTYFLATSLDEADKLLREVYYKFSKIIEEYKLVLEKGEKLLEKYQSDFDKKHDTERLKYTDRELYNQRPKYIWQVLEKGDRVKYCEFESFESALGGLELSVDKVCSLDDFLNRHYKYIKKIQTDKILLFSEQDGD